MRRTDDSFNLREFFRSRSVLAAALAAAGLMTATGALAASTAAVHLVFTVPIPPAATNTTGGLYGYDISFVDQSTQTYYLGDRSNAAVDVVDAAKGKFIKQITATPPFAGATGNNSTSGPNGVATDGKGTCLFAGDGTSRVVSFLLPSGTQVSSVATGGSFRADEMAYDPKDHILVAANNADTPPFATLFKVTPGCALTITKKITYTFATNGAEQPAYDSATGLFYQSIPQIGDAGSPGAGLHGLVIGIDPTTGTIKKRILVSMCQPAGLSLNPTAGVLLAGCSVVFDRRGGVWSGFDTNVALPIQVVVDPTTGVTKDVAGVGASDEVWYNGNDGDWYTGSSSSPYAPHSVNPLSTSVVDQGAHILGVIDGSTDALLQLVPTFSVPATATHLSGSGHSVAANDTNGWVFVPSPANYAIRGCQHGCIQVFER